MLLGSETPRLWTRPLRRLSEETSAGFAAIRFAENVLGWTLLPWQKWVLIHGLELLPDGTFRFRTILLIVGRQNGKTTLLQVIALWRMYMDGAALTIGTAQNLDIAEEAWAAVVEMAEGIEDLADEVAAVDKTNGKKQLRLAPNVDEGFPERRYKVAASGRRGGRGLSGDLVFLDELREHQTWEAWAAVTKTTMARRRPQIWAPTNAGDLKSVVLNHLRRAALRGLKLGSHAPAAEASLGIFEYSAGDDIDCTCEPDPGDPHGPDCKLRDPAAWAQANPALNHVAGEMAYTEQSIEAALLTDPVSTFRTEVLCQFVASMIVRIIADAIWDARLDPNSTIVGERRIFSLDTSLDRKWSAIGVAGYTSTGLTHVEVIEHEEGNAWTLKRCIELARRYSASFVVDPSGPAGAQIAGLRAAGVNVIEMSARDAAQAAGMFFDGCENETLVHIGQAPLDEALGVAAKRDLADAWAWGRKQSDDDICSLVAVSAALWGLITQPDATVVVMNLSDLDETEADEVDPELIDDPHI